MKDERLCDVTPVRFTDAERDDDKEEDEDNDADGCSMPLRRLNAHNAPEGAMYWAATSHRKHNAGCKLVHLRSWWRIEPTWVRLHISS